MLNANEIIDRLGGIRPAARRLNRPVGTVSNWKTRNSIPESEKGQILTISQHDGLGLSIYDLYDIPNSTAAAPPTANGEGSDTRA